MSTLTKFQLGLIPSKYRFGYSKLKRNMTRLKYTHLRVDGQNIKAFFGFLGLAIVLHLPVQNPGKKSFDKEDGDNKKEINKNSNEIGV